MKTREGKKPAPRWQRCRYLCRNAPKFFLVVRLKAYLEELLDSPVGIIRKHQHLNPFLLKEIEKDGIEVIANRNER